ncbi:MAG: orotidine-5'-phosphate decarboxylase [Candidatus Kryptonium sp.]|nr:orotidine-5'-phosphate decarboxylase [Candidatus Kryptonium sp.]MDW8108073.1 orotidine-5'-phosphate decarboxylase [Candidatus Kryptonium sp.]
MSFIAKLKKTSSENNSLLCIGIDTDIEKLPEGLAKSIDSVLEFNRRIIESTYDVVCAYKINTAFYEALGTRGFEILKSTIDLIPKDIPFILDAKRGDIRSSCEMYAKSLFTELGADAITVNPYFGVEAIEPFVKFKDKFTFVVVLSSNQGAFDFQYLKCEGKFLFQKIAEKFINSNFENLGFVVGATRGEDINLVRELSDEKLFLIPGIGEQGGDLELALKHGINKDKIALINVGRTIIYASSSKDFAQRAREKAIELKDKINKIRENL